MTTTQPNQPTADRVDINVPTDVVMRVCGEINARGAGNITDDDTQVWVAELLGAARLGDDDLATYLESVSTTTDPTERFAENVDEVVRLCGELRAAFDDLFPA